VVGHARSNRFFGEEVAISFRYLKNSGSQIVYSSNLHSKAKRIIWNHIQYIESTTKSKAEPLLTLPLMFIA
jgi:hypothetical protein